MIKTGLRYHPFWLGIGIVLLIMVVVLSLIPSSPTVHTPGADKVSHLLAYGTLMFWFKQLYEERFFLAVAFVSLGIVLEFLQGLTGYRSVEVYDAVANAVGVLCGGVLAELKYFRPLAWCEALLVVRK